MALVGLEGLLMMVDRAACTMLGRDAQTLHAMTFQDLTHPDDLDVGARRRSGQAGLLRHVYHPDGMSS